MMRHIFISLLLVCGTFSVAAQNEDSAVIFATQETNAPKAEPIVTTSDMNIDYSLDSLHLPTLNSYGQMLPLMHPLGYGSYWGGWYGWGLHKGLNVSLGASVFAQFGKGAYHGAGFQESISAMYAIPVTKHLSVAIGGYFNNINWGRYNTQAAGLSAIVGYQFNDKWEAYLYAQKCLTNNSMRTHLPMPMYDYADLNDRIGAAVKYNFSPSFSMQLSVEMDNRPAWVVPGPINLRPDNNKSLNDRP